MAINGVSRCKFEKILAENLTPSATIRTRDRLFGRDKSLQQIQRALSSAGRQILLFGDRGVGKTSVANTSAALYGNDAQPNIYVPCSRESSFESVIQTIGRRSLEPADNIKTKGTGPSIGLSVFGVGGNYQSGTRSETKFELPKTTNDALEIVRFLASGLGQRRIIVVDEMERVGSESERAKFAEFIKNVPEMDPDNLLKFVFCGIGSTVDELIGAHPSAGRIIEPIHLDKLHHTDLWKIIQSVAQKLSIEVDENILIRIGQLSDGFPHYVHLVGESIFWQMFDDSSVVKKASRDHFHAAVRESLQRAEPALRQQYEKATMKTKNTEDYEEALWALADTTSEKRQLSEIYDYSYKRIMSKRFNRIALPKEKFNKRLLMLRTEGHGEVVVGYGAGWFGFRENIIRGYVRLVAETRGVQLGAVPI
jgi:Cdc6-like AAA superfamily ATPase